MKPERYSREEAVEMATATYQIDQIPVNLIGERQLIRYRQSGFIDGRMSLTEECKELREENERLVNTTKQVLTFLEFLREDQSKNRNFPLEQFMEVKKLVAQALQIKSQ